MRHHSARRKCVPDVPVSLLVVDQYPFNVSCAKVVLYNFVCLKVDGDFMYVYLKVGYPLYWRFLPVAKAQISKNCRK